MRTPRLSPAAPACRAAAQPFEEVVRECAVDVLRSRRGVVGELVDAARQLAL